MLPPDQKEMFDALEQQRQHQRRVDRVLAVVLPITAFLLSCICANLNKWSTLGTFFMLWIAFYATGIKRLPLWHWTVILIIYAVIDNYLSYHSQLRLPQLRLQLGTMLVFLAIVAIGRPYYDRWLMKK